jgi:hypothetical protein
MLLRVLTNTNQPWWRYLWKAVLIALIPSLIIGTLVQLLAGEVDLNFQGGPLVVLLGTLVISPWGETLLMALVLKGFSLFIKRQLYLALACAGFWAVLHSLASPQWGLVVFWPFFVFSICYLSWRERSFFKAVGMTGLVHTGQNLLPSIVLLFTL